MLLETGGMSSVRCRCTGAKQRSVTGKTCEQNHAAGIFLVRGSSDDESAAVLFPVAQVDHHSQRNPRQEGTHSSQNKPHVTVCEIIFINPTAAKCAG